MDGLDWIEVWMNLIDYGYMDYFAFLASLHPTHNHVNIEESARNS